MGFDRVCKCGFNFDRAETEDHACPYAGERDDAGLTKHVEQPPIELGGDNVWLEFTDEPTESRFRISQIGPTVDLDVTPPTAQDAEAPALVTSYLESKLTDEEWITVKDVEYAMDYTFIIRHVHENQPKVTIVRPEADKPDVPTTTISGLSFEAKDGPIRWWPLPLKWTSERPKTDGNFWYRQDRTEEGNIFEVYTGGCGSLWVRDADVSGDFPLEDFCYQKPEGEWSDAPIARPEET